MRMKKYLARLEQLTSPISTADYTAIAAHTVAAWIGNTGLLRRAIDIFDDVESTFTTHSNDPET